MSKLESISRGYTELAIEPYTPNIGAVIHDFDLSRFHTETVGIGRARCTCSVP